MRLTLDLLQQAPQSLNPAKQRQLLLRGFKIPAIENLGGTNDAYECLDLGDNDLIRLGNFPPLKRLHTLLLMNNRISRIAEDCFEPLPCISSVVLTGNKLEKLVDLEPLAKLKTLERLSLLENPVTRVKHYRPYMINKCGKNLRILDFNRIKEKERKAAALLFAGERGKKLLEEIAPPRVAGKGDQAEKSVEAAKAGPSPEVIERIKKAIAEAETIEEVTRLERALKSGVLPDDLKLDDAEDEAEDTKDAEMTPAEAPKPLAPIFVEPGLKVAATKEAAKVEVSKEVAGTKTRTWDPATDKMVEEELPPEVQEMMMASEATKKKEAEAKKKVEAEEAKAPAKAAAEPIDLEDAAHEKSKKRKLEEEAKAPAEKSDNKEAKTSDKKADEKSEKKEEDKTEAKKTDKKAAEKSDEESESEDDVDLEELSLDDLKAKAKKLDVTEPLGHKGKKKTWIDAIKAAAKAQKAKGKAKASEPAKGKAEEAKKAESEDEDDMLD